MGRRNSFTEDYVWKENLMSARNAETPLTKATSFRQPAATSPKYLIYRIKSLLRSHAPAADTRSCTKATPPPAGIFWISLQTRRSTTRRSLSASARFLYLSVFQINGCFFWLIFLFFSCIFACPKTFCRQCAGVDHRSHCRGRGLITKTDLCIPP